MPQTRRLRLADSIYHQPAEPRPAVKQGWTLPAGMEPLLSIDDLTVILNCSRRLVERIRSAGKIPKPDLQVGRMPRWKPETVRRWIEQGGIR